MYTHLIIRALSIVVAVVVVAHFRYSEEGGVVGWIGYLFVAFALVPPAFYCLNATSQTDVLEMPSAHPTTTTMTVD